MDAISPFPRVKPDVARLRTDGHWSAQGLVGAWYMAEGAGDVARDASGRNYDGAMSGPTWDNGSDGSILSFDGTNDYITIADTADLDLLANQCSCFMRAKLDTTSDLKWIVGKPYNATHADPYAQWMTFCAQGTQAHFRIGDDVARNNGYFDTSWHNYHVTWDGSKVTWYIDGCYHNEIALSASITDRPYDVRIGTNASNGEEFLGKMSTVILWDRVHTAEEVQKLSANPLLPLGLRPEPVWLLGAAEAPASAIAAISDYYRRLRSA